VDFDDTPEEAKFRAEARAWLDAHAPAKGGPDDFSTGYSVGSLPERDYLARCQSWQAQLGQAGWAGITWPRAFGGRGANAIQATIFAQEQARYGVSTGPFTVGIGMAGPTIIAHGTDRQKQRYLPPLLRGEELWCQLFSEPGAGSDLAGLSTRAERDGDQFVVNGQKVWTSGAHYSRFGILLARTDFEQPKHRGITYFVLDMTTSGIEVRPLRQMTGASHFSEVFLSDVRIPVGDVLGQVDGGWAVAMTTLANERMAIGAGGGVKFADMAGLARARGRAGDPLMRQALAAAYTREQILTYLGFRVQTALSRGALPGPEASVTKLFYAGHLKRTCDLALALQGVSGVIAQGDAAWQHQFLQAPSIRIAGGSDEVQRNVLGERVLGLPGEPRLDKDVAFRNIPSAGLER